MLRTSILLAVALLAACDESDDALSSTVEAASAAAVGSLATPAEGTPSKPRSPEATPANLSVRVASGGNVSPTDASAIASVMRSGLRRCAPSDANEKLVATLSVEADPSGKIHSAAAQAEQELPADFKACLERSARTAYFPETAAGAKVKLEVRFGKH